MKESDAGRYYVKAATLGIIKTFSSSFPLTFLMVVLREKKT